MLRERLASTTDLLMIYNRLGKLIDSKCGTGSRLQDVSFSPAVHHSGAGVNLPLALGLYVFRVSLSLR
jgi:hypothetical protein